MDTVAIFLIVIIMASAFLVIEFLSPKNAGREFYVGVEYAYGNQIREVEALVDKVKSYTNFFVLSSIDLTFNRTALTEACDYIYNAKLNFVVQFTGLDLYNYTITSWMEEAKVRYGDSFLGIYRYDEPGGHQLDSGSSQLINRTAISPNATYQNVSNAYVGNLSAFPAYYLNFSPRIFTADYGLYWFDYKANYTTIFAECVGNESRQRHFALCRGAAETFSKDWGTIVTWKYDQAPYLESPDELYSDLSLAYATGAKYAVVFSYPQIGTYGTLTEQHFEKLQEFWNNLQNHADTFGSSPPQVAYVVPKDYGFGFRSANDTVWGLFNDTDLSAKIYADTNTLTAKYGAHLDILYDEPEIAPMLANYSQVYFWNQTMT
jgi:hypothetical protein